MDISIVIVNYNVRYFLEQCLISVFQSGKDLDMEVFVVDNNSVDGSVEMVREKFPSVKLIANQANLGFSKANNQAIRLSSGRYVLLLNPDTVLENDTLPKVVQFMDGHPDAGGLGVRMLDGRGRFLPESKRGLPTPSVAFYKIFGLSALFPKSRKFGRYHLGFLKEDQIHEVDVLSGAFMLLRKETLDRTGLLDEAFFMYGEDIDLSFRIKQAGYKNYYFPEARIIHYKGESTKKSSINYVFVFYNAMLIFAQKHFSQQQASHFSAFIHFAIYFRAFLAIASRFIKQAFYPLLDAAMIYIGFFFIKDYWAHHVFLVETTYYPAIFMAVVVPAYIVCWLVAVYIIGGYDKPIRLIQIVKGLGLGTLAILVIYALLPESWRFSRALILLGSAWALVSMLLSRGIINLIRTKKAGFDFSERNKRILVVGDDSEAERITQMLRQSGNISFIGLASTQTEKPRSEAYLGTLAQINEIIDIFRIDEVIFCAGNMPSEVIIDQMAALNMQNVNFKIAPPESLFIIGSNSIDTFGDLFTININAINKVGNRRAKRLFDVTVSLLLLVSLPVHLILLNNRFGFIKNLLAVIFAKKSWIGYHTSVPTSRLPEIKKGILSPGDAFTNKHFDPDTLQNLNKLYAKDYKLQNDIIILSKSYAELGRTKHIQKQ